MENLKKTELRKKSSSTTIFLVGSFVVVLFSLFTLFPSFNLALSGDDWLAFWRYLQHLGPESSGQWSFISYFLTPYGAQDILMGQLQKIYGYNPTPYFITSFIFRLIAIFSLLPLSLYFTKSKLASFFALLFLSSTVIGLDTTHWVFNMPSYIAIAFFNLFLYFFILSHEPEKIKFLPLAALMYYAAYITAPIRMHGAIPIILLIEFFWILRKRSLNFARSAIFRIFVILLIFIFISKTGQSTGVASDWNQRFLDGLNIRIESLKSGQIGLFFYPIIILGGMFIPDIIFRTSSSISSIFEILFPSILIFLAFSTFLFFLIRISNNLTKGFLKRTILFFFFWQLFFFLITAQNLSTLGGFVYAILLNIGGYVVVLTFSLLIESYKNYFTSTGLTLSLAIAFLSFFAAWWWMPNEILYTAHRYLIISGEGIALFLAIIIGLGSSINKRIYLFSILSIFLIIQIYASRIYLNFLLSTHSQEITNKIWSSIPHVDEIGKSKEPIIFYFEGEGNNGWIIHDAITFGFPPHMALIYNLSEGDGGIPVPMSNINDLVSAVTDGKALKAYGYPIKPVSEDRVYAFHLQGSDNLINITDLARDKLKQLKLQNQVK